MAVNRAAVTLTLGAFVLSLAGQARPEEGSQNERQSAPELREVETRFSNGELELAGRFVLPAGEGPFPAVVFTHGSGDAGRDNPRYREEADYFARHGIASLLFDKRGSGDSEGDWKAATFEDLAEDAVAALEHLESRPEIDGERTGFRGASQSGWILPVAAAISDRVDFLILISPPGTTPYEQILYDVRTDLEDAGYAPDVVERGVSVTRSGLDWARKKKTWAEHERLLRTVEDEPWFSIASGPPVPNHWMWSWIRPLGDFDAFPHLRETSAPVLVILGERDRETPSQIAGFHFEQVLRDRGGAFRVVYFPDADHDLRQVSCDPPLERQRAPLVEGYLEAMRDWMLNPSS